jgi:hypothetical protein
MAKLELIENLALLGGFLVPLDRGGVVPGNADSFFVEMP